MATKLSVNTKFSDATKLVNIHIHWMRISTSKFDQMRMPL